MSQQQTMFQTVNGPVTVNNFSDPPGESETSPVTVKFKDSMKEDLQKFCFEHDISRSEFLRDAAQFYRKYYACKDKLTKYERAVSALLESLP